jgi:nitrogen-specific signal transduction histidine kinase
MLDSISLEGCSTAAAIPYRASHPASTSDAACSWDDMRSSPLDDAGITEILEELDTGVIVCNEEGRLKFANNAARCELQHGRLLSVQASGLLHLAEGAQAAQPKWQSALRAATVTRRRQLLALCDGDQRLMVSVMPLGQTIGWALVMLGRRQLAPKLAVEMLGVIYELTGAEQRVLAGLLAGERVETIAGQRGVMLSTLRTQVNSLREKLGANRLEDVVRLAACLPPMSSVLRSPPL